MGGGDDKNDLPTPVHTATQTRNFRFVRQCIDTPRESFWRFFDTYIKLALALNACRSGILRFSSLMKGEEVEQQQINIARVARQLIHKRGGENVKTQFP